MIPRPRPERFRLRRTMMFMNAQKPGLIKDAYIYGVDSIMLDLEDAVAENQKDSARFSLYHALKTIDYGDTSSSASTASIRRTGRKISAVLSQVVLTASASRRARARRMSRRSRSTCSQPRRNSASKRAAR